jgi:hypothetical protein
VRRNREPYYVNNGRAQLEYAFGRRDRVYIEYSDVYFRDDNPNGENSRKHEPAIGFNTWLNAWNGLSGRAGYTRGTFEEETDDFTTLSGDLRYTHNFTKLFGTYVSYMHQYTEFDDDLEEDYHVYSPSIGITYTFAEDGFLEAGVGYFLQDRDDGDNEDGYVVNLDVGKDWQIRRLTFRISGSGGFEQTYFRSENLGFTRYYGASGGLSYALTKNLELSLQARYRYNEYLDEEPEREDHTGSGRARISYQVTPWLSLAVSDVYRVVDSTEQFDDYKENRVIFSLDITPGPYPLK